MQIIQHWQSLKAEDRHVSSTRGGTCGLTNNGNGPTCDGSHGLGAETSGKIQRAWWKFWA